MCAIKNGEMQNGELFDAINGMGERLSLELGCPVTWPGYDKNVFRCKHGWVIPVFRLRGSDDWSWVKPEHDAFLRGEVV